MSLLAPTLQAFLSELPAYGTWDEKAPQRAMLRPIRST